MVPQDIEDTETAKVFRKAIKGKNGRKRCCHAVKILVKRAEILPEKQEECVFFLVRITRECGVKSVIDAIARFAVNNPRKREFYAQLNSEVCFHAP